MWLGYLPMEGLKASPVKDETEAMEDAERLAEEAALSVLRDLRGGRATPAPSPGQPQGSAQRG
jgi:hypothetical protein